MIVAPPMAKMGDSFCPNIRASKNWLWPNGVVRASWVSEEDSGGTKFVREIIMMLANVIITLPIAMYAPFTTECKTRS